MSYRSPRWLRSAHAQTIWPLALKGEMPHFERERLDTPDGDFVDIDFLPRQAGKPLVTLFHGLEGSSRSHYARALMRALMARGWNGAVVHFRGCSGEPNRLARAYHSGDADEIDWALTQIASRYPDVPRYAAGVSLGGNALLCWLGTRESQAHKLVDKAAAVSAPLDLTLAGHHLNKGFNRIYTRHFLTTLQRAVQVKAQRFPGLFDAARAAAARNLFEFDDAYTAPMHGFADAHDYWRRASSKPLLRGVAVPTLIINARNDPFMPPEVLPQRHEVSPMVELDQPAEGGHVGFVGGSFPGHIDWLPRRLLDFFSAP
ncbi:MAG: hydrolase [Rhodocyclaceae bacterium]